MRIPHKLQQSACQRARCQSGISSRRHRPAFGSIGSFPCKPTGRGPPTRRFRATTRFTLPRSPALRSRAICGVLERIEHCRAQAGDIAIIACHQRQAIGQRGRGEKAVSDRNRPDGAHASPLIGDGIVDAEHASTECALYLPQPAFERRCLARISATRVQYPFESRRGQACSERDPRQRSTRTMLIRAHCSVRPSGPPK
jgi:hypothetical protein